jgi:hypothetical protein
MRPALPIEGKPRSIRTSISEVRMLDRLYQERSDSPSVAIAVALNVSGSFPAQ